MPKALIEKMIEAARGALQGAYNGRPARCNTMTTKAKCIEHAKQPKNPCECADPLCPVHKGVSSCAKSASVRMKRADMDDRTGVKFCRGCADDASESSVFGPAQPLHWKV